MTENNIAENTSIPSSGQAQIPSQQAELSRSERRKLRKQEFKEQQKSEKETTQKKKLIKNIALLVIFIAIIGGLIILFRNLTKETFPTIGDDPLLGPTSAAVTVIEFGDFQCPYTRSFQTSTFKELKNKYGDKIKWVFRDMPTGRHALSGESAEAAQCANEQGKFWEYHDLLFDRFAADPGSLRAYARQLGLDIQKFEECISSKRYRAEVNKDYREGKKAGVRITPTFFVNNIKLQGDVPLQSFEQIIESQLNR